MTRHIVILDNGQAYQVCEEDPIRAVQAANLNYRGHVYAAPPVRVVSPPGIGISREQVPELFEPRRSVWNL